MKIRNFRDSLGKPIEIRYSKLSDGKYSCAIKGFQYPYYKTVMGKPLKNDLGFGISRTKQAAFELALKEFKNNPLYKEPHK